MSKTDSNPVIKMIEHIQKNVLKDFMQGKLDYDSGIKLLTQKLPIAENLDSPDLLSSLYTSMGVIEWHRGDFEQAYQYFDLALDYARQSGDNHKISLAFMNIGEIHREQKNIDEASKYYQKALELAEQSGETRVTIATLSNEAQLWFENEHPDKAIELLQKARDIIQSAQEWKDSWVIITIADIYIKLAQSYCAIGDFEQAELNADKGLLVSAEQNLVSEMAHAYHVILKIKIVNPTSKYDTDLVIQKGYEYLQQMQATGELGRFLVSVGDFWLSQNNEIQAKSSYEEAIIFLNKANLFDEAEKLKNKI